MSFFGGPTIAGNLLLEPCDDVIGFIDAERGLRDVGDILRIGDDERVHVLDGFDERHLFRCLAERADRLIVSGVSDQDHGSSLAREPNRLHMDFGDERTSRVDRLEIAIACLDSNLRTDSMGAIDQPPALGNLLDGVDEYDTAPAKPFDDVIVVNDLVIDVKRRTEELQGAVERADCHDDAGAKPMRIGQYNSHTSSCNRPK